MSSHSGTKMILALLGLAIGFFIGKKLIRDATKHLAEMQKAHPEEWFV
jgi:uncharacterized protein YneF (UPF0154 family)